MVQPRYTLCARGGCVGVAILILQLTALGNGIVEAADQSHSAGRRLSYQMIAGYAPETLVTSQNAIDLDQEEFIAQLSLGTDSGFDSAMQIYSKGAFSEPVAYLNLTSPLAATLTVGDRVIGTSQGATTEVRGSIVANYPKGTSTIVVKYDVNEIQSSYVSCQVAANPNPKYDGCFASDGLLVISGVGRSISYSYNPSTDNRSQRSIGRFSTDARLTMELCAHCPLSDYLKFRNYYGSGDYADHWIRSAYEAKQTSFSLGDADFSSYGYDGRLEAMTKASAYMSIFMQCIREMEEALGLCQSAEDDTPGVHSWDAAVAFYTGSLEGTSGSGHGVLMYSLADKQCQNFKTCGANSNLESGTSYVNLQVFDEFRAGQLKVKQRDCDGAKSSKERIVQLMTIPLIQSTLLAAHIQSTGRLTTESVEAEGATFAGAVLPFIYDCGEQGRKDAAVIYENMKTGHQTTHFDSVQNAFENSYQCLGITCSEVGGIWNKNAKKYVVGSKQCTRNGESSYVKATDEYTNSKLALGLAFGGAICVFLIVILSSFLGKKAAPVPSIVSPSELL